MNSPYDDVVGDDDDDDDDDDNLVLDFFSCPHEQGHGQAAFDRV